PPKKAALRARIRGWTSVLGKAHAQPVRAGRLALLRPNALLRAKPSLGRGFLGMTNTRKILIVDDDAELRDALVEQLSLHEEFESIAVDNGTKGVQAAKA